MQDTFLKTLQLCLENGEGMTKMADHLKEMLFAWFYLCWCGQVMHQKNPQFMQKPCLSSVFPAFYFPAGSMCAVEVIFKDRISKQTAGDTFILSSQYLFLIILNRSHIFSQYLLLTYSCVKSLISTCHLSVDISKLCSQTQGTMSYLHLTMC